MGRPVVHFGAFCGPVKRHRCGVVQVYFVSQNDLHDVVDVENILYQEIRVQIAARVVLQTQDLDVLLQARVHLFAFIDDFVAQIQQGVGWLGKQKKLLEPGLVEVGWGEAHTGRPHVGILQRSVAGTLRDAGSVRQQLRRLGNRGPVAKLHGRRRLEARGHQDHL